MPERLFFELDRDKREKITEAALAEFAAYGYDNSSTNRIVRACGISKGSLFLYFSGKEDLYMYVAGTAANELAREMELGEKDLPAGLFERIAVYSAMEISWYINNPLKGRLLVRAFSGDGGEVGARLAGEYGSRGEDIFRRLIRSAETDTPLRDRERSENIIKWVLEGFNACFLKETYDSEKPFELLREEYLQGIAPYLDILRGML